MSEINDAVDASVADLLQRNAGGTAYWISNNLGYSRAWISNALQRLKRRGQVTNNGT